MKKLMRCAAPVVMLLAAAARGQAGPAAPENSTPYLRASVASTDTANKLIAELGLPVPDVRSMLESKFTFMGENGVAGNKPLGVVFFGTDPNPADEHGVVILVPAAEGKATADSLVQMGGKADPNQPGLVDLGGISFRRTANYLMFQKGPPEQLQSVADDVFAGDYRQAGTVALVSFNFGAFKKAAPNTYKEFVEGIRTDRPPALNPTDMAGQQVGETLALSFLDQLEKVTVALGEDATSLHFRSWLAPFDVKAVKPAPRPAFPADVIMQMHVVYPDASWSGWMGKLYGKLPNEMFEKMTAEQATRTKAVLKRMSDLYLAGDAVSLGVSMRKGRPTLFLVTQRANPVDYAAEIKAIADQLKDLGPSDDKLEIAISSYAAGAVTVTRLAASDAKEKVYVDAVQQGNALMVTFSMEDGHFVQELAELGMKGTSHVLCAGVLDLQAALAAGSEGGGPFATMPPDALQNLRTAFAGQAITWTVQTGAAGAGAGGQANYLYTDLQVPTVVVRQLVQTGMGMFMATPANR